MIASIQFPGGNISHEKLEMFWQIFGKRMERRWKWTESKKRGIFFLNNAVKCVYPVLLNHVIFYCPQKGFLSNRLWRFKIYLWVCSDCMDTHYSTSQTRCWWNILLYRADTNWYLLTFLPLLNPDVEWRPLITKQVVVLWLLQKQLCVLSQQMCW